MHRCKLLTLLLLTLCTNAFAGTRVINANVVAVVPVYIYNSVSRMVKYCEDSNSLKRSCAYYTDKPDINKILKGYKVALEHDGVMLYVSTKNKPTTKALQVRVLDGKLRQGQRASVVPQNWWPF